MIEIDRLMDRLFSNPLYRLVNLSIFPGDTPSSAEQIAAQLNSALDQKAAGTTTAHTKFPDITPTVNVREYLGNLGERIPRQP